MKQNLLTLLFTILALGASAQSKQTNSVVRTNKPRAVSPQPMPSDIATSLGLSVHTYPFRKLGDSYCDLRPLFAYLKSRSLENLTNPMPAWTRKGGKVITTRSGVVIAQFAGYTVGGQFSYGAEFAIKNHPHAAQLAKGGSVNCVAVKVGTFQYNGETIDLYDHGIPYVPETQKPVKPD